MNEVVQYQNCEVEQQKPLTAADIKAQVQIIQQVMEAVMKEGHHYGKIPGTPKPTLFKPGSEKLLSTFRIGVDPSGEMITDLSTYDCARYRVAVKGFSQTTGALLGVGIGECSSDEEKYKWRRPVCDEEFNETPDDRKRLKWAKGENGPYQIKQIRTNPADVANTILKMAKKRGQIDMTLTVTAASDIFDQDLEDLPEGVVQEVADKKPPVKPPQKKSEATGANSAAITIKEVIEQIKTSAGAAMKNPLYHIHSEEGGDYKTFDKKLAELATANIGKHADVTFDKNQYGNDMKTMVVISERTPGEEG